MIDGAYTFNDVSKSKYQIGFGKLHSGVNNFISKFISAIDDSNIYSAELNATQFPLNDVSGAKNYANFKFFPKCPQYDLMTPPPLPAHLIPLPHTAKHQGNLKG